MARKPAKPAPAPEPATPAAKPSPRPRKPRKAAPEQPATDAVQTGDAIAGAALPVSEVERLLCAPRAEGALDTILPRRTDAWDMQLGSLADLPKLGGTAQPIRVCIAAEQITGPVRNGGIGTTYAALALMLARHGFDITVLYLRGLESEIETIDYWIRDYAEKGVKLVPVPDYARAENFASGADRWLRAPYNMLRWLIDNPMDVVHVSEWRGSAYLSLLAKRQGLAFGDTLFLVKTSSPWMWNRLYGSNLLERVEDFVKIHAERQSVELADVVIGGSLHLLRWMASQGYAVPRERAFVQPNVVTFETLEPLIRRRALPHGERTPIEEFVFFGRLEARKGLYVFCQAIRRLIRKGVALPPRITFMGKPGARLPSHPDIDIPDFIHETSKDWPTQVQIISSYQQYEAIEYLLGGARLAVMPSIIENSSMAIYEAAICAIPAVATNVGGNAELIDARDHGAVLCTPHPVALGDKLEEALRLGGMVPRPSFDNDANLATWMDFHHALCGDLRHHLLNQTRPAPAPLAARPQIAVCIYFTGNAAALEATLASLAEQHGDCEAIVAVDAASNADLETAAALIAGAGLAGHAIEAFDLDAGAAFNAAAAAAKGSHVMFLWEGASLYPEALETMAHVIATTGADVLTWLYRAIDPLAPPGTRMPLCAQPIIGPSDSFFRTDISELPLVVARDRFAALGGFTTDYRVAAHDHEFVARAQIAGCACQSVMRELGTVYRRSADWLRQRGYDMAASGFRVTRPELAAAPLAMRDQMLFARGLHTKSAVRMKSITDPATPESMLVRMIASVAQAPVIDDTPPAKPRARAVKVAPAKAAAPAASPRTVARHTARKKLAEQVARVADDIAQTITERSKVRAAAATRPATPAPTPTPPRSRPLSAPLRALVKRGEAASAHSRYGQLLGVFDGRLYGWAIDTAAPDTPVEVELVLDGARGRPPLEPADRAFAPFAVLPAEAARRGFVFDLPPPPAGSSGAVAYAVASRDGALMLGDGMVLARGATLDALGIDAGCIASDDGVVRGWARRIKDPTRALDVALFVNGVFMGRARADQTVAQGDCGFAFEVPRLFREAGRHRVDVVIARLGIALPHQPLWIEGASIAPTTAKPARKRAR